MHYIGTRVREHTHTHTRADTVRVVQNAFRLISPFMCVRARVPYLLMEGRNRWAARLARPTLRTRHIRNLKTLYHAHTHSLAGTAYCVVR